MKRRGATAQRISEKEASKGASLAGHCIAKEWEPGVGPSRTPCGIEPRCLGMYIP